MHFMKNYLLLVILTSVCYSASAHEHDYDKQETVIKFKQPDTNRNSLLGKTEATAQLELTRFMEISNYDYGFEQGDINSDNVLDLQKFLLNEENLPL